MSSISTEHLTFERDGATAIVTMNRPEAKNALSLPMLVGMKDAWEEIDGNDDIRCAILTGAGGTFCAGMDPPRRWGAARTPRSTSAARPKTRTSHWKALLRHYDLHKPLMRTAVEGWAVAGGTEILQATHIRLAGESAVFGVFEANWPRLVSPWAARPCVCAARFPTPWPWSSCSWRARSRPRRHCASG